MPTSSDIISPTLRFGTASWRLYRHCLRLFFPEALLLNPLRSKLAARFKNLDSLLAWGNKRSTVAALSLAHRSSIPLLRIEDGFLYGLEPGASERMSLVIDDLGIYYDAAHPSRLERLISDQLSFEQIERAQAVRILWLENRVSKYNHAPDWDGRQFGSRALESDCATSSGSLKDANVQKRPDESFILLIDQTFGDQSVAGALADASSFSMMLDAALAQTAVHDIIIKVHPEVASGRKKGYFDLSSISPLRTHPRIQILDQDVCLSSVISKASSIYTVSSQAGFEGLLWGKPVHTFGMPFYAGWGLTSDHLPRPARRKDVSLEQLIYASLVSYPRYVHPETGRLCQAEEIIAYLGIQRRSLTRIPHQIQYSFSPNKNRNLAAFTQFSEKKDAGTPLLWGAQPFYTSPSIQIEDGFIRSVGLGADLNAPISLVFDRLGIYYDARYPSELECMLNSTQFASSELAFARTLRQDLIDKQVSKYNLREVIDEAVAEVKKHAHGRRIILVPGQVETDASIIYGSPEIRTNLDLLKSVRNNHPDAFIIYKTHPDVANKLRQGSINAAYHEFCDYYASHGDMCHWLELTDELHTMTSLSGFEALIREKKVVCYGLPFYAGWGLTEDVVAADQYGCFERRNRKLTIDELIVGALIKYPLYIHPRTGLFTGPMQAIQYLANHPKHQFKFGIFHLIKSRLIRLFIKAYHLATHQ